MSRRCDLQGVVRQATIWHKLGIERDVFDQSLDDLIAKAETDMQLVTCGRPPETAELRRLFECAYDGRAVDF